MLKRRKTKQLLPDGRKYRLVIISLFVLLGGFALAGLNPTFAAVYAELVAAILGLNALYYSGNVGNKWVVGKAGGLTMSVGQNLSSEVDPNANVDDRGDLGRE